MSTDMTPRLKIALASMPEWADGRAIAKVLDGGISNSNWLVSHEGHRYFLKLFGIGTEQFVDRKLSNHAAEQAASMEIAPRVIRYDAELGFEVIEFLEGYRASTNADFSRTDFLQSSIDLYRKFNSGTSLPVTKDVFAMTDEHIDQGNSVHALRPMDFEWLLFQYQRAKSAFTASGLDLVPCHNDPMPGNFMVREDAEGRIADMKLVDFEFASNNERAYELAVFLAEMFVDELTTLEMIERYYGAVRPELVARIWVARAVADMKWGSWAVQQRQLSSWDFDYQKYGIWKYARARSLFEDPRWTMWLSAI